LRHKKDPERGALTGGPESPAAEEAHVAADLSELEAELERIRREADEAADRALRTLAEFDNYRKRTDRERRDASDAGAATVLRDLLEVVDNFDRAFAHAEDSGESVPPAFLEGMKLVARGLHDLLDRRGVKRIEALGQAFDPHRHEAIASEPAAGRPANEILREVQTGYAMGDRVLRPAKVIVARAAPEAEA
jgi:molecular chaperone GrpE